MFDTLWCPRSCGDIGIPCNNLDSDQAQANLGDDQTFVNTVLIRHIQPSRHFKPKSLEPDQSDSHNAELLDVLSNELHTVEYETQEPGASTHDATRISRSGRLGDDRHIHQHRYGGLLLR